MDLENEIRTKNTINCFYYKISKLIVHINYFSLNNKITIIVVKIEFLNNIQRSHMYVILKHTLVDLYCFRPSTRSIEILINKSN